MRAAEQETSGCPYASGLGRIFLLILVVEEVRGHQPTVCLLLLSWDSVH